MISWRDIPAQVNGGVGGDKHQHVLPRRFQTAIDRAAVKAGKRTASEYVAEWRRQTVPLPDGFDGDLAAAVRIEAERLEHEFSAERLRAVVDAGGWAPDVSLAAGPPHGGSSCQRTQGGGTS